MSAKPRIKKKTTKPNKTTTNQPSNKICQHFLKRLKKQPENKQTNKQTKQNNKKKNPNNKYISEVFHLLKKPDWGLKDGKDVTRAGGMVLRSALRAGECVGQSEATRAAARGQPLLALHGLEGRGRGRV